MALIVIGDQEADKFDIDILYKHVDDLHNWIKHESISSTTIDINQTELKGIETNQSMSKVQGTNLTSGTQQRNILHDFSIGPSIVVVLSLLCVICVLFSVLCSKNLTIE